MEFKDIIAELQDALATAHGNAAMASVHPVGLGSRPNLLSPVAIENDRVQAADQLDMARLVGVQAYEPSELYVTALAGTPVKSVLETLAAEGQTLAFEPHSDAGSIGGLFATAMCGSARPWTGAVRDAVLGISVLDGRGQLLRFGGTVVKNVAGYDVSRLLCGAWGAMGAIVSVTLRVAPLPERHMTLARRCGVEAAHESMVACARRPGPIQAMNWSEGQLTTRLLGPEVAVQQMASELQWDIVTSEAESRAFPLLGDQGGDQGGEQGGELFLLRLLVPPATPVHEIAGALPVQLDWAGGLRWYDLRDTGGELPESIMSQHRHAELWRFGSEDSSSDLPVDTSSNGSAWSILRGEPEPLRMQLLQNVKRVFDPCGVFARAY